MLSTYATGDPPDRDLPDAGRILLAEDDRAMRELIARSLRDAGFSVGEARSGIDLLALIEQEMTDRDELETRTVIVSDIRMRRLDGLAVVTTLRGLGWRTPVILITAFPDDGTRAEAARMGARLLDKPFDLADLAEAVRAALDRG